MRAFVLVCVCVCTQAAKVRNKVKEERAKFDQHERQLNELVGSLFSGL